MPTKESPMRASANFVPRFSFIALAGLLLSMTAAAQTGLATVTGIVSDESGGAVPGLTVTAVNQATNIAYTGVTNTAGNYIMTSVPIGAYVIAGVGDVGGLVDGRHRKTR